MRIACPALLVILLSSPAVRAQELGEAAFLGSLDGAVHACAAAFPEHAARYRKAVKQLVGCHLNDAEIAAWRARLRDGAATSGQYAKAFADAGRDLAAHPASRQRQCASLDALRCDPAAGPSRR